MLLFINKPLAIISVGVCCAAAEGRRVGRRGPAAGGRAGCFIAWAGPLLLSVVPVKVTRGSLYHRLSATSGAIEEETALGEIEAAAPCAPCLPSTSGRA